MGAGERGEAGAAGDEDGTTAAAGQQGEDLALAGGVVEDDEDAPRGEAGPVHLGALVEGFGDELAGDPEGSEEAAEDLRGGGRGGGGAAQVAVELPVGEACLGEGVGDVDGQGRLAGSGLAGDGGEADGAASVAACEGLLQGAEPLPVGDEVGDVGGELMGNGLVANRFSSGRGRRRVECGGVPVRRLGAGRGGAPCERRGGARRGGRRKLAREDGGLEVAQFAAGFEPELLREVAAGGPEGFQGLGLPAGPVEGLDELTVQLLPQGVLAGEPLEFPHEPVVVAEFEFEPGAELHGGQALLVELPGRVGERAAVESGEAVALPERDRGSQEPNRLLAVAALAERAGALHQTRKEGGVDVAGPGVEHVPGRSGREGDLAVRADEQLPQPGDADLHLRPGGLRRIVLPDEVDQLAGAHDPVGLQEERGEDHLLPAGRHAQRPGGALHLERPEDPEGETGPARNVRIP